MSHKIYSWQICCSFVQIALIMKKTTVNDCLKIVLPKIEDPRGNLSVIEKDIVPFAIKRVYFLYDVPSGAERGGHAHKNQISALFALSGSFEIVLKDGSTEKTVYLNKPYEGMLLPQGIWREIRNFSSGAVCLVVTSDEFLEEDYIRGFEDFLEFKREQ